MLRFEWNALRPGDHVVLHDPRTPEMTLTDGVVTGVETHKRVNGVGIRVAKPRGDVEVLWPSPFVVHSDPRDPTEQCWRCDELEERPLTPLHEVPAPPAVEADEPPRAFGIVGRATRED